MVVTSFAKRTLGILQVAPTSRMIFDLSIVASGVADQWVPSNRKEWHLSSWHGKVAANRAFVPAVEDCATAV